MSRWFQIKMLPTTKFHNFSRSTKFSLVICSSDIVFVTLFPNFIYVYSSFMKLWDIWERWRFYEKCYYRFVKWRSSQNKRCRSWEVIQLCSWKLFHLNSFRASKSTWKNWFVVALGKDTFCRVPEKILGKMHLCWVPNLPSVFFAVCFHLGTRQSTPLRSAQQRWGFR